MAFTRSTAPRVIQSATKYGCACIGDSNVFNVTYLTTPQYFPNLLLVTLAGSGCAISMTNSGESGDTTGQVLVRAKTLPAVQSGALGIIYVGTNDLNWGPTTVQASPTPTSTVFAVGAGLGSGYQPNTNILVGGVSRVIQSVSTDTITLKTALAGAPSAGTAVAIDTVQNIIDTNTALVAAGYTRTMVGTQHYLNFSSGGDTLSVQQTLAQTTRTAQYAVVSSLGVPVADFYTWMRNLIVAGTYTQGDALWHVADGNGHLNAIGQQILCDCIMASMPASWAPSLRI